ncbi:MAG: flagellar FlbD family protein [Hyphomonas sp.]
MGLDPLPVGLANGAVEMQVRHLSTGQGTIMLIQLNHMNYRQPVILNTALIMQVIANNYGGATIDLMNGSTVMVTETYDEVMTKLVRAKLMIK